MPAQVNAESNAETQEESLPIVSISTVTYNHEHYIGRCIESAMMQRTNFRVEMVIGEDCSTDSTREICKRYAQRYPDRIHLLLRDHNMGSMRNFVATVSACQGKYVAMLDGDDYWIDPHKLSKQVAFMEDHPECAVCFHPAEVVDESGVSKGRVLRPPIDRGMYDVDDLLRYGNFAPTPSVLYRNGLLADLPPWFLESNVGDWPLLILNAEHGQIGFIDETMSAYREHTGGLFTGLGRTVILKKILRQYRLFKRVLDKTHRPAVLEGISRFRYEQALHYMYSGQKLRLTASCLGGLFRAPDRRWTKKYIGILLQLYAPTIHRVVVRNRTRLTK